MKQLQEHSRHNVLWAVILCYLFPFIGLSSVGALMPYAPKNWSLLCVGLLLSATGSLVLYWVLARWEFGWNSRMRNALDEGEVSLPVSVVSQEDDNAQLLFSEKQEAEQSLHDSKQTCMQLQNDVSVLVDDLQKMNKEKERLQQYLSKVLNEFDAHKEACLQQQEQYQGYIHELQGQLSEQKQQAERKQYQISHLETKVGDLTYEIKTLLQIAERHLEPQMPPSLEASSVAGEMQEEPHVSIGDDSMSIHPEKSIRSSEEASIQLKRSLDIAQKITGSNRFTSQSSSFLDSPADHFTLDLRRLCDTLRCENNSTIVLYSPKENQPLFVNNHIRESMGWSPEKFIQNFNDIIHDSVDVWRQGMLSLASRPEIALQLSMKARSGSSILVKAHLGLIPTGIFRHHAIAILYTEDR